MADAAAAIPGVTVRDLYELYAAEKLAQRAR
jgi:hypothetical protein